jgi:hypothetical protein
MESTSVCEAPAPWRPSNTSRLDGPRTEAFAIAAGGFTAHRHIDRLIVAAPAAVFPQTLSVVPERRSAIVTL